MQISGIANTCTARLLHEFPEDYYGQIDSLPKLTGVVQIAFVGSNQRPTRSQLTRAGFVVLASYNGHDASTVYLMGRGFKKPRKETK